ncbi:MAG: hypothetical protein V3U04_01430 [Candidatus Aerophobetes bacterium]
MGRLVPILPRLIVPVIASGRTYIDTIEALFQTPVFAIGLCLWTALPFAILALSAKYHLGDTVLDSTECYHRAAGIIGAFVAAFAVGFFIHIPQTVGGVNFGIILFPFYTIAVIPLGYWLPRIITERLKGGFKAGRFQ